jgi:ribose 5-phosphate isomerase A
MRLGLGTGRAAEAFIRKLGEAVRAGLVVTGVATSERSEKLAREVGIATARLDELAPLDVAFDGADEVSPDRSLVKGLGGALLRERVVAFEARRFVVLVTPEKLVERLGTRAPIPIEVVPFAVATARRHVEALGATVVRRAGSEGMPFVTDNQNAILDARFEPIDSPRELDAKIRKIPGVVDTGFFFDLASVVLCADPSGVREI